MRSWSSEGVRLWSFNIILAFVKSLQCNSTAPYSTVDQCLLKGTNPSTSLRKDRASRLSVDHNCGIRVHSRLAKRYCRRFSYAKSHSGHWCGGPRRRGRANHLATMADLHRAGRYDRMSDDVLTLTGKRPLSLQEFVRKNAATFTASTKDATQANA